MRGWQLERMRSWTGLGRCMRRRLQSLDRRGLTDNLALLLLLPPPHQHQLKKSPKLPE